ncbi:MAG: transposase [Candidatus Limnocylindria bacterium]
MAYNFRPVERDQQYLMPVSLRDWLPADDLAWFVLDAVAELDLSSIYARYRADGWGAPAFEPAMMSALLLYAYASGERSSRRIEARCRRDIAYRIITANQTPDHATIARFRSEHEAAIRHLFDEVLRLCAAAGLGQLGLVALDGTRIAANAALAANRTVDRLSAEIDRILAEAAAVDAAEDAQFGPDRRGDELPAALADPRSRLARLQEAKRQLAAADATRRVAHDEHLAQRAEVEAAAGRGLRGRKPKPPQPAPKAKVNVSDPQSRIMKTATGYLQGYNAQAVVSRDQVVLAADLTHSASDAGQLGPMLAQAAANVAGAGFSRPIGTALADAGYWSEAGYRAVSGPGQPQLLVATHKGWKHRRQAQHQPPRGRIPAGLSLTERMERRLRTKHGQDRYRWRAQIVEPVFGQAKDGRGFRRFSRRGRAACAAEWQLMCATHNLLKLWRSGRHHRVATPPRPRPSSRPRSRSRTGAA